MPSILEHVWGVSLAADRVWAQVSGLAPSKSRTRLLMVLQAFIDDSYDRGGTFVLAGHIATAESWAAFSKEWEEMLPYGTRDKDGRFHFKMTEMAENRDRMERVPAFFRIIEKHVLVSISCKIDQGELKRAQNRIWVPGLALDWSDMENPYMLAYRCLLDMFHSRRRGLTEQQIIPLDQKVDFIFDRQTEARPILAGWESYMASRPEELRPLYGAMPRFEDDKDFLPLQAADFWAWWSRRWYNDGTPEKMDYRDFGGWHGVRRPYPKIAISFDEDQLVEQFRRLLRDLLEPGRIIYDVRFSDPQL